jgi:hypothetical protein
MKIPSSSKGLPQNKCAQLDRHYRNAAAMPGFGSIHRAGQCARGVRRHPRPAIHSRSTHLDAANFRPRGPDCPETFVSQPIVGHFRGRFSLFQLGIGPRNRPGASARMRLLITLARTCPPPAPVPQISSKQYNRFRSRWSFGAACSASAWRPSQAGQVIRPLRRKNRTRFPGGTLYRAGINLPPI